MFVVNKPRILVTGGSGFVGNAIVERLKWEHDVHFTYHENPIRIPRALSYELDLRDEMTMDEIMSDVRPEVLIHTAAMTSIAECEEDWQKTYDINVRATSDLLDHCRRFDCKMVYLSTDIVFDGSRGNYEETDHPFPVNRYGKSKRFAEEVVLDCRQLQPLVFRTGLVYGWSLAKHPGPLGWLKNSLDKGEQVTAYTDEYRTSIFLDDLVILLREAIAKNVEGLYNVAGHKRMSRYDFAVKFAEEFGYDKSLIRPGSQKEYTLAKRPADVSMNTTKLRDKFEHRPRDLKDTLSRLKKQLEMEKKTGQKPRSTFLPPMNPISE